MSAVAYDATQEPLAAEAVAEAHGAALAKASDKNSAANFLIGPLDTSLLPKANFLKHVLINNPQTFPNLLEIKPFFLFTHARKVSNIIPASKRNAAVDGDGPEGSMQQFDPPSDVYRTALELKVVQETG